MFDTVQILEDFVEVAAKGNEFSFVDHNDGFAIIRTEDHSRLIRRRRPEFLKDRISEVLSERQEWTGKTLCARLRLPHTQSECRSIGKIVVELGWESRKVGQIIRYRKSFNGYQAVPGSVLSDENILRLSRIIRKRSLWTTEALCRELDVTSDIENKKRIGRAMKSLGWVAKNGGPRDQRVRWYTNPAI